jgi:ubiquinone/menaquinone biosynthesis C-methylase UbiE
MLKKKIKSAITKLLSPRSYWTLVGATNPYSAAIEGVKDPSGFYELGNFELNLFKKLKTIEKSSRTLEIGCGPGRIQAVLVKNGYKHSFGTDFSPTMIKNAKKNVKEAIFSVGNGKDLHQYSNKIFDLVYSFVVFQHTDEEIFKNYLAESNRVLSEKGKLLFQIQSSEGLSGYQRPTHHPWKLRRYLRQEVVGLLKNAGFNKIEVFDMDLNEDPKMVDERGFLFLAEKV